jgi:cytochrome c-type biogenesis protein CcsB
MPVSIIKKYFLYMKLLSSYLTTVFLLLIFAVVLATATFIEKTYGAEPAKLFIYYSPVFALLQLTIVVNFVMTSIKHNLFKSRRWGLLMIHSAFIIIFTGALVTHFFSREGYLHLRENMRSNRIEIQSNHQTKTHVLPFEVELEQFTLKRYPGSQSPSSFQSDVMVYVDGDTLRKSIFMNNVMDVKGYRFFQASYDEDERGTVLSVNQDVAGRDITYFGYTVLLVGAILCLTSRRGRIRTLYRMLNDIRKQQPTVIIAIMMFTSLTSMAASSSEKNPSLTANVNPVKMIFTPLTMNVKPAKMMFAALTSNASFQEKFSAPSASESYIPDYMFAPSDMALRFGALPMQSENGRIIPVKTFASEALRKLHKETKIKGVSGERFLLSVLTMPDEWMQTAFIRYSNDEIAEMFDLPKGYLAYMDVFDEDGNYKMQRRVGEAYATNPAARTRFNKDIILLDEQINVLYQILNGQLLRIFPCAGDKDGRWFAPGDDMSNYAGADSAFVTSIFGYYLADVADGHAADANQLLDMMATYQKKQDKTGFLDDKKIAMELRYENLEVFRWCKIGYLAFGGCLLVMAFMMLYRERRWVKWVIRALGVCVLLVFHFQMMGMAMRWRIGGYAPWSNSYETMVYVAWATTMAGLLFMRRSALTFALSTLFAGVILFVSSLNWMDPQIGTLAPVLKSPWLMFHVAVLMAAYGFFGISFLLGLTNMTLMSVRSSKKHVLSTDSGGKSSKNRFSSTILELSVINEISLLTGLLLVAVGIFMGAVWANESWGRYWGWDPKETWALITLLAYVIVTHLHLIGRRYSLWLFNLCSVIAFATVLMTYFGVNYFLSGMHSYGQNDALNDIFVYLYAAVAVIIVLAVTAKRGQSKLR